MNRPESEAELEAVGRSVSRGAPYGEPSWQKRTAKRLKLESSHRPPPYVDTTATSFAPIQ